MRYLGASALSHRAQLGDAGIVTEDECQRRIDAAVAVERSYDVRDAWGSFVFGVLGAITATVILGSLKGR